MPPNCIVDNNERVQNSLLLFALLTVWVPLLMERPICHLALLGAMSQQSVSEML